jgi:16S rRNA G966 N2-methylase RsmD
VFGEVFTDTLGPVQIESLSGNKYAVHFTETLHESVRALGHEIKMLKSDNVGEFVNDRVKDYAKRSFILRTSPPTVLKL